MYFRGLFIPVKPVKDPVLYFANLSEASSITPESVFCSAAFTLKKLEHYKLVNWRCLRVGPDVLFQLD